MLFNLIATFALGLCAAGTVMIISRLPGVHLPRYLMPMAAAAAMVGFHIWNDYSWFQRTSSALPERVEIAERYTYASLFQPWTLLLPRVDRFAAIDRASIRRNQRAPGYVMAEVILVRRLNPTAKVTQIYHCETARRMDIAADAAFDAEGLPLDPIWSEAAADDPLLGIVCASS